VGLSFRADLASVCLYDDDGVWRTMFSCNCGFVRCKFVLCS
jgi:hypothetical protein